MAYQITKRGNKTLIKTVQKYNAKITRLSKDPRYQRVTLPTKVDIDEIRASVTSAKDLQREIRNLNKLFTGNALDVIENQEGLRVTRYSYNKAKREAKAANTKRQAELDKYQQNVSMERGNLHTLKELDIKPMKFDFSRMSERQWKSFSRSVEKQARSNYTDRKAQLYKENYLRAVKNQLGPYAKEIFQFVSTIPARQLYDDYFVQEEYELDYIYSLNDMAERANKILLTWRERYPDPESHTDARNYDSIWKEEITEHIFKGGNVNVKDYL